MKKGEADICITTVMMTLKGSGNSCRRNREGCEDFQTKPPRRLGVSLFTKANPRNSWKTERSKLQGNECATRFCIDNNYSRGEEWPI